MLKVKEVIGTSKCSTAKNLADGLYLDMCGASSSLVFIQGDVVYWANGFCLAVTTKELYRAGLSCLIPAPVDSEFIIYNG